jgi:hypothetical protein
MARMQDQQEKLLQSIILHLRVLIAVCGFTGGLVLWVVLQYF